MNKPKQPTRSPAAPGPKPDLLKIKGNRRRQSRNRWPRRSQRRAGRSNQRVGNRPILFHAALRTYFRPLLTNVASCRLARKQRCAGPGPGRSCAPRHAALHAPVGGLGDDKSGGHPSRGSGSGIQGSGKDTKPESDRGRASMWRALTTS